MEAGSEQPFCPNCDRPLDGPTPIRTPGFVGPGFSGHEGDRSCPNCEARLVWDPKAPAGGVWVAAPRVEGGSDEPRPANLRALGPNASLVVSPKQSRLQARAKADLVSVPDPAPGFGGLDDRIVTIAEVAAATPWSKAALRKLAAGPGSPFRKKAGIWVARESAVYSWIESDDFGKAAGRSRRSGKERRSQADRRKHS